MRKPAAEPALDAEMPVAADQAFDIVLKPIAHPELDDIRIDDELFAIGRNEAPFVSYDAELIADLSRRHARIFTEFDAVYLADLGSKNGTSVNGVPVRQKPVRLRDGDAIRFGGELSFRLRLAVCAAPSARPTKLRGLTLTPERGDLGLQPIVIARFPFLLSKNDEIFARYKEEYPQQIDYLSRRHAHLFLKNGLPCVEDLGSTNGTFVAGRRLDEHAVALQDGDLLALGGHHFVYRVSLQKEFVNDPTLTRSRPLAAATAQAALGADKTTFVAAADSFLDIFCVDQPLQDAELNKEAAPAPADGEAARRKGAILLSELREALGGGECLERKRALSWAAGLAAGVGTLALWFYLGGAPERDLKALLDSGDYARAAIVAGQALQRQPESAELKALGSEALLKAKVPEWLARLKARDFAGAAASVAAMKALGARNPDVQPLLDELEWMGDLEQFVASRGGDDAPIRIYADEERIGALLERWNQGTQGHQRAFSAIAARIPAFGDVYAEALSHLRKLQSDDSVYLAAIERLKATIATELQRDRPEALEAVLTAYAEKYPRLGGLDSLRRDLRQDIEVENEMRARSLGPLIVRLAKLRLSTPPFRARLDALNSSGRLPPPDVVEHYRAMSLAWRAGDTKRAFDALQKLAAGPWADAVASETAHKRAVAEQFAELQQARGSKAYDERLLAFHGALDPDEDVHFIRAGEADLGLIKDKALQRAQALFNRAQGRWRQYRENGAIEAAQRLDTAISPPFRTQARLLAEAHDDARQALRIHTQLKVALPEPSGRLHGEIKAEAELQRNALLELSARLAPALLKAKLELIGERRDEQ